MYKERHPPIWLRKKRTNCFFSNDLVPLATWASIAPWSTITTLAIAGIAIATTAIVLIAPATMTTRVRARTPIVRIARVTKARIGNAAFVVFGRRMGPELAFILEDRGIIHAPT